MIKENDLSLKTTVNSDDKVRIVTKNGLSQSIEVDDLKSSLSIDTLSGKVSDLETKDSANDTAHETMNSRLDDLELIVGDKGEGEIPPSGLVKKVNAHETKLAEISPTEISGHGDAIDGIHERLTEIDGTNGRLDVLTDKQDDLTQKQTTLESIVNAKLDQSTFQSAVDEGFKVISKTPTSASAPGEPGEVCWNASYFYVCVASDTWKRTPLESW